MKSIFEQQAAFMKACGQSIPSRPVALSQGTLYALQSEPILRLIGALAIARDHISDLAADLSDDDESRQALMYFGLMLEEFRETVRAFKNGDIVETLDGLIDTHVVTAGAGLSLGLPMDAGWREVMRSNMSKLVIEPCGRCDGSGSVGSHEFYTGPLKVKGETIQVENESMFASRMCPDCEGEGAKMSVKRREDGKILKPEGYTPPNLAAIIHPAQ